MRGLMTTCGYLDLAIYFNIVAEQIIVDKTDWLGSLTSFKRREQSYLVLC